MQKSYDVIIIGKGPAGISASLYTARSNLKTLIIGRTSDLSKSHMIENYYGFKDGIQGSELLKQGEAQTAKFGAHIIEDDVIALTYDFKDTFIVKTKNNIYESKAVLLTTGSPKKNISIKNMDKFIGKGVHFCTTCDGYFYRGKKVGMLGYNEYALNETSEMKNFTQNIILLTNGKKETEGFQPLTVVRKKIVALKGEEYLQKVEYEDGTEEDFDAIFVAFGTASSADFARKLGIIIKNDLIEVDDGQKTNLDGLYAAGDCCSTIKQVAVAVGQGAVAGMKISEFIRKMRR